MCTKHYMKLLCEMHYEYLIGTKIFMLSALLVVQMGPTMQHNNFLALYSWCSQVADWKFTKCIFECRGKCGRHPGITAAAVMGDVTQHDHPRQMTIKAQGHCRLVNTGEDWLALCLDVNVRRSLIQCQFSLFILLTTKGTHLLLNYAISDKIHSGINWNKHNCTTMAICTALSSSTPFLFVYPGE